MTKPAYLIVATDIHDPETFGRYVEGSIPVVQASGAEVLAATNDFAIDDGEWPRQRIALVKFASRAQAEAFYYSEDYAPLKAVRQSASDGDAILVEGMEGASGEMAPTSDTPHYLLGASTVTDTGWIEEYMRTVPPLSAKFGVQGLAVGNEFTVLEGSWPGESMVLLRCPSEQAFRDFWYGDEYRPMKALREANSTGAHISFAGVLE
jgi:uncharacterized protein (DUF1330 family)